MAFQRTGFLSWIAFTFAPRVRRVSIRGVEGKRAELQRAWSRVSWSRVSVVDESSVRTERALGRFLLSMAEMSRFLRLEKPVARDASRGLDFGFGDGAGGGDRTPCCTSTSVVVSVSDLVKLPLEREGEVDVFGDSIPSGPESSTTHCQEPYSRFGRLCPSVVVVPMTILAFGPSVMLMDRWVMSEKANLLKAVNNVMLKTSRLLISAMSSPPSLSRSQELFSSVPKL